MASNRVGIALYREKPGQFIILLKDDRERGWTALAWTRGLPETGVETEAPPRTKAKATSAIRPAVTRKKECAAYDQKERDSK